MESFAYLQYAFSRDKHNIYLGGELLCANTDGFKILAPHKALDNQYYYSGNDTGPIAIDKDSFQLIDDDYAKDTNQVIARGHIIPGADPASFQRVNQFFNRDKHAIYCENIKLDVNPQKSVFIDSGYVKDDQRIYFLEKIIEAADPESFEYLGNNFSRDRHCVYHRDQRIDGADAMSFQVVNYSEFIDKNYCYYFQQGELKRKPRVKTHD